jgi:hypothetical protein
MLTMELEFAGGLFCLMTIALIGSGLLLLLLFVGAPAPSTSGGGVRRDLCATFPKLLNLGAILHTHQYK